MIIPVRCPSCGKPVADKWEEFKERAKEGNEDPKEVLDDIGLERYCCRSLFLSHVELLRDVSQYKQT